MVGACGAVSGSSTASFRVAAAPVVEAADLGRLFCGEGTRKKKKKKKKKQRKEGREEASSRWRRSLWWSEGKKRKKKKKKIWGSDLGRLFWGEGTRKKKKKKKKKKQRNEGKGRAREPSSRKRKGAQEDRAKDVVVDLLSTAEARLEIRTLTKVEARGFGSGSGKREPPVTGSLTRGWDRWYEVKIGTLEASEGRGMSWLGRHELARDWAKEKLRGPDLLRGDLNRSYEVA
ncbi:hypothetical protein TIFTF001_041400 [Ficus carica]|uniref:Uncharacterized protein n=1 Tax=Ficus carica TaxID=3494 RepID=A0AA87ZCL4_FICCA|nr:hypothetical protein TIFTF001_041400 [Ficus carica]